MYDIDQPILNSTMVMITTVAQNGKKLPYQIRISAFKLENIIRKMSDHYYFNNN